jgi:hypothetical protein
MNPLPQAGKKRAGLSLLFGINFGVPAAAATGSRDY